MSGPVHSWIFRSSLVHGGALLGLVLLAIVATAFSPRDIPSSVAVTVAPSDPADAALADDAAAWPRTALRLWFLVPQFLLPRHDR